MDSTKKHDRLHAPVAGKRAWKLTEGREQLEAAFDWMAAEVDGHSLA